MSLDVDVTSVGTRPPLAKSRIIGIVQGTLRSEKVRNALVSVTLLDKRAIARLNKEHLGHAGPTDVISFGFTRSSPEDPVIGDIYICPAVAAENARAHGQSVRRELARLVVHGTLHVLGHDHPVGDDRESSPMWRRQERLVARLTGVSSA
jgi:probable rRNA maturation factor